MSDKITLLLEENLIKQAKKKAIDSNTSISEICRVLLNAWQSGLFGIELYENTKNIPAESGVYILVYDNEIKYVGSSQNIKTRIHNHAYKFDNPNDKMTIFYFIIDKHNRTNLEKLCISILNPEMNIVSYDENLEGYRKSTIQPKRKYSDYAYINLTFVPDDDEGQKILDQLAEVRPDRRTALIEKWYQAYKKGQNEQNL